MLMLMLALLIMALKLLVIGMVVVIPMVVIPMVEVIPMILPAISTIGALRVSICVIIMKAAEFCFVR